MASPTATKRENRKGRMTKVTPISGHHRELAGIAEGHVGGAQGRGGVPYSLRRKTISRKLKRSSPKHISFEDPEGGMNSADTEIAPGNIVTSTTATAKLAIGTAVGSITIRSMSQPKFSV